MGLSVSARRDPGARLVAAVFLVALLFRLEYLRELFSSGLWSYLRLDPLYYHDWAVRIAHGDVLGRETFEMTPLYAYALGGLFHLCGDSLLLPRLLQSLAGALACALVAMLGMRIFGRLEGLAGGLAMAAYGPALFHDAQIMKTVLTVTLSTATAALLYHSGGTRPRLLLAGGVLLGLTALCQENIDVTLPLLAVWILWRGRSESRHRRAARVAALLAGFVVLIAPATIRNYLVSGDLVLITSGGGEVFYTGNNEHASGKYQPPAFVRPDPFFEHEDFRTEAARRLGHPVTRRESDAFWWKEGTRFIAGHPAQYAALLWDKTATYFNAYERPDNYSYDNFRRFVPLLRLSLLSFGLVAPLGLIGLALSAGRLSELLPLYATIGCYMLSGLLFFTQDRYRMPMIPLLDLFAAHAAIWIGSAVRRRDVRSLAWAVPALAALALFVNRDPGNSAAFEAQNHGILGEMYLEAGRPGEAEPEFGTVLRMMEAAPAAAPSAQDQRMLASAHYGIVLSRAARSGDAAAGHDDDETILHLRAAGLSPDPDTRRDALAELGRRLLLRGDAAGAAVAYAGAVEADPARDAAGFERRLQLAEALHQSGRAADALRVVQEALASAPTDLKPALEADAHYGEALIYLRDLPDPPRAAQQLREVLRLDPDHPRAGWIRQTLSSLDAESPR